MNESDSEFFDKMAPVWDSITRVDADKIRHILSVAEIPAGADVLDVGTGTGVLIPFLRDKVPDCRIDAVDHSAGMLSEAEKKHGSLPGVRFILANVENDNLEKEYDCILMYCMYPHLAQGEETVEWLAKTNLKPGGKLLVAFPEKKEAINGIHAHNDGSVHSVKLPEASVLGRRFEARGLTVDHSEDSEDYYILRIRKP